METQHNHGAHRPKISISFFFLSLGVLVTLVTTVVSFLNLVFGTLDKRFPDVLNSTYQYGYSTGDFESIRMALATLIIFFPVFLVISYFWKKFINKGLNHSDEVVKKWLVFIVLFISSLVVVIDLVTLVNYFISGEITNRFILKVVVTLLVALLAGAYYLYLLGIGLFKKSKMIWNNYNKLFALKSIVFVVVAISYSFYIMGSPMTQRLLRLDDRRITDLQSIQYQVINYWQQKEALPENIATLSNPLSGFSVPVDPEFEKGTNYEYIVKDKLTFDLCATFALPIPKGWRESNTGSGIVAPMYDTTNVATTYPYPGIGGTNESWDHQAGRTCFTRTIDTDMYPPYPKQPVSAPVIK